MTRSALDWLLGHFSRRTTSGRYIAEVDGLRFFSIAMVVLYHVMEHLMTTSAHGHPGYERLARVAALGRFGPHLFFVISGFVLALPFAQARAGSGRPVQLKRYYLRRLKRIEPPYMVAMTIILAAVVVLKHRSLAELLPHYGASLLYLNHFLLHSDNPLIPVSWSLEVEVQFYILAPLLASVFLVRSRIQRLSVLLAVAVATVLIRPPRIGVPAYLPYYAELFIAGFVMADVYVNHWKEQPKLHRAWDLVAVSAMAGLVVTWLWPDLLASQFAFPLLALALFCAAFAGPWTREIVRNRPLTILGGMCYTIYLLHFSVINNISRCVAPIATHLSLFWASLLYALAELTAIVIVSAVFFVLIERPCMREDWPSRLIAAVRHLSPSTSRDADPAAVK